MSPRQPRLTSCRPAGPCTGRSLSKVCVSSVPRGRAGCGRHRQLSPALSSGCSGPVLLSDARCLGNQRALCVEAGLEGHWKREPPCVQRPAHCPGDTAPPGPGWGPERLFTGVSFSAFHGCPSAAATLVSRSCCLSRGRVGRSEERRVGKEC